MKFNFIGAFCALFLSFNVAANGEVIVYDWAGRDNLGSIFAEFEKESGIKVNRKTFKSGEDINSIFNNDAPADLVIPLHYAISDFISSNKLVKIDVSKLTNYKELNHNFIAKLRARNLSEYALPYLGGTLALVVDEAKVKAILGDKIALDSWNLIFHEEYASKLSQCGISLVSDPFQVFSMYQMHAGFLSRLNSKVIVDTSNALKPLVPYFNSQKEEDSCVSMVWSTYAIEKLKKEGRKIYVPQTGTLLFINSFVLPQKAKNIDNAYKFMDFMLRPSVHAKIVEQTEAIPVVKDIDKLVNIEFTKNVEIFPSDKDIRRFITFENLDAANNKLLKEQWHKLKP